MISRTATIASSVGLHARPAAIFAQKVAASKVEVSLTAGDKTVNAASILEVMTLGVTNGQVVELSSPNDDAGEVLDELVALLETDLDAQ